MSDKKFLVNIDIDDVVYIDSDGCMCVRVKCETCKSRKTLINKGKDLENAYFGLSKVHKITQDRLEKSEEDYIKLNNSFEQLLAEKYKFEDCYNELCKKHKAIKNLLSYYVEQENKEYEAVKNIVKQSVCEYKSENIIKYLKDINKDLRKELDELLEDNEYLKSCNEDLEKSYSNSYTENKMLRQKMEDAK